MYCVAKFGAMTVFVELTQAESYDRTFKLEACQDGGSKGTVTMHAVTVGELTDIQAVTHWEEQRIMREGYNPQRVG